MLRGDAFFETYLPATAAVEGIHRDPLCGPGLRAEVERIAEMLGKGAPLTAVILRDGLQLLVTILGAMLAGTAAPLNPELTSAELSEQLESLQPYAVIRESGMEIIGLKRELPADTRLILPTSATTGRSKLTPLTGANIEASIVNQRRCFALNSADRFLAFGPLFHLHALGSALAQLAAGGTVICTGGFDPVAFPQWLREFRPTWYTGPPAVHRAIASLGVSQGSLRFVRSSSAALGRALQETTERCLGVPFLNSYGLTEAGTITATPLPPGCNKPGSSGVSVGPEITILEPDREIAVRGANVMSGYLDGAATFREGWFLTGDLGYLDADGHLFITGRLKETINRGGVKIMPAEVDAALMNHPDVVGAAAFGVPHPGLGEEVAAAVVLSEGSQLTAATLSAHLAQTLAAFKVPRRIQFLSEMPQTATGKPNRAALRELFHRFSEATEGFPSPLELRIASIWAAALNLPKIGAQDDLFDLGADSLSAAIALARVAEEFGSAPSLENFFKQPTVRRLAESIESGSSGIIHLHGEGSLPPLFCVPAQGDDPYYLRYLAGQLHPHRSVFVVPLPTLADPTVEALAAHVARVVRRSAGDSAFVLAGHCFGGVIAFEAACQLCDGGVRPKLLVLFDSPTPGYPKRNAPWHRYPSAAWSLAREKGARSLLQEIPKHLRLYRRHKARTAPAAPVTRRTLHSYRPRALDCEVMQVMAADERVSTRVFEDERLGWRDFVRGDFKTVSAAGDHNSILLPPYALDLARRLEVLFSS